MFKRKQKKLIAVVIYPGMTALDLVGTLEALVMLQASSPYRIITVGARTEPVQTDTPLKVVPARTFAELPRPVGLFVPGGGEAALAAAEDDALRGYVRAAAATAELVLSVGTGSLILAAAGLLEGRLATTHWAFADRLETFGVTYQRRRWVEDGKFITAGGVTAGIDAGLHVMEKLTSRSKARFAQLVIEYDPQPPFGGIDWERVDGQALGDRLVAASPSAGMEERV